MRVETTEFGWTFHTLPGHFFDGTINFALTETPSGEVRFGIFLRGNHTSFLAERQFELLGRRFEAATWNALTEKVGAECQR